MAESHVSQSELQQVVLSQEAMNKENSNNVNSRSVFRTAEFERLNQGGTSNTMTVSPSLHPYDNKQSYDV